MKRAIILTLAVLLSLSALPACAGNLYAILFINTEDQGIGCIYDALKMGPYLKDAEKSTGLKLKARIHLNVSKTKAADLTSLKAWAEVVNGWSKADLEKEIKALAPTKDDTVLFYYSGHGGRMSDKKGQWPDMALQNDGLVDLQYPVDLMAKKGAQPRLMLSFGDCCNSYMDRSVAMKTRSAKSTTAMKDLFLGSSGTVVASGCVPGQYSLGGSDGGVFTNAYLNSAYNAMNTTWDGVLKNARTLASTSTDGKQVPQFKVEAKGLAVVPATTTPTTTVTPPAAEEEEEQTVDNGGGSGEEEEQTVSDDTGDEDESEIAFLPVENGKASGRRDAGDSDFPFVELKSASLNAKGDDLVVTFDLVQLPKKMPFNDKETPADSLEYEWGVYIDADGSGEPQYEVCLVHFKEKGAKARSDTLENQCQAALYDLTSEDGESLDAEVEMSVNKNRITLTVPGYEDYFTLEDEAQVFFSALYYPGGESYIP